MTKAENEKRRAPTHIASAAPLKHNHVKPAAEINEGADLNVLEGTAMTAVANGIVRWTGVREGYGLMVEIDHGNGLATRFNQNTKVLVKQGDRVVKGQQVAISGPIDRSKGSHRRFEILKNGVTIDPLQFVNEDR